MDKLRQRDQILEYINFHGSITVRDIYRLGINGGTARISDLRKDGYNIQDQMVTNGRHRYKVYFRGPDIYNNYIDPQLKQMAEASNEFIKE